MSTKILPKSQNVYEYPLLIKRVLEQSLKYEPKNEIVYRDVTRYNYFDLNSRIRKLANALTKLGITAGDTVAVIDFDSPGYLELYFAVPMIGAILHTINYRLSPSQVLYTINHAEDKVIFTHTDFLPLIEGISKEMSSVEKIVAMTDYKELPESSVNIFGKYEELLSKEDDEYDFPDFDENSVATIFYTTGTTGNPKAVYFSHRQLVLHTLGLAASLGSYDSVCRFRSNDVYMPITPMFHVHAWGIPYLATMLGVKQIYPGRYEPAMLLKLLVTEKVTFSHCVPTILHMLVNSPAVKTVDLSNWKVVIGGAALPSGLARKTLELGIDVITGYGLSETCPVLTLTYLNEKQKSLPIEEQVKVRTKAGIPVPLVDLKIVDEEGKTLPHDGKSVGEIVVRAPWLTEGYFKEPGKSEELWTGGFLHTGDVAFIDENNFVKITDRIKDVIKTGGEWISTLELENLISKHSAVNEVAVVGIPDEVWTERPHAMIVLKEGETADKNDIQDFLQQFVQNGTISKWTVPESISFVSAIPKTSVGKIDKKKIRNDLKK
ncbi:long-chain-fatty-acid--CoA ligase [bacterium BMS3Abin04]|nr:long-chain-fatty-acid--CoA ligase [bacterium BMS3Abin04]